MELKYTFDEISKEYEKFRPGYPKELFNDIIKYSNAQIDCDILEIGCGTGQATQGFVDIDYKNITCIEIGKNLSELTSEKYKLEKTIKVHNVSFEEWNCEDKKYDLAISATAFHFIDPKIGYPKVFNSLKLNGSIGFFWTVHVQQYDDLYNDIRKLYRKYAPELDDSIKPTPESFIQGKLTTISEIGLFKDIQVKEYRWIQKYSSKEYVSLLNTHSKHRLIDYYTRRILFSEIEEVINKNGGTIEKPQLVALFLARK